MSLPDLTARIPPPREVVAERSWDEVAGDLGVRFAPGYREVVEAYGQGRFEPGTMLFDPRRRDFDRRARELGEIMADPDLRAVPLPHPPHPGDGPRLLPVTSNGSGGYVMTVVVDGEQDESSYWLADLDDDEFREVPGPFGALLLGLADGSVAAAPVWQIGGRFLP